MPPRPGRQLLALACVLLVLVGAWGATPVHAAENAKLVLVLDSSGSMKEKVNGQSKISIAKSSLRSVVAKLPADAPVGLRVYGATVFDRKDKGACTDSQLVVPIGTGNRPALTSEINSYRPYGETPISYSLLQAAKDLGDSGKRTILLVSDGEETCDADPCDTAAAIAKSGVDVKIDVVGLAVAGKTREQLQCVARRGNGTYYDADSRDDLEASLDKLATRAFRPFRVTGTPVKGTVNQATAPEIGPGQYVDSFPASAKALYYRIPRTAPGSTVHLGFTALAVGFVPTVSLRLYNSEGGECDWDVGQAVAAGNSVALVAGEVASWRGDEASPCNTGDELVAQVAPSGNDLLGAKFELLVSEEPPLTDDRDLPPSQGTTRWQRMSPAKTATRPPVPGTSLSDAPLLAPGIYRSSILTGESQVFAVNADWGQRVQVDVTVAPRRGALARALSGSDSLDLQLLGAGRGRYTNLQVPGLPERSFGMPDDEKPYRFAATTPTITYTNRSQPGAVSYAAVPGPQYVVLNMSSKPEKPFLVPYTLLVTVVGTAGEGRPAYLRPTPTPTPSPIAPSSPATEPPGSSAPSAPPASGSGLSAPAVVALAVGALALGAGATALIALLRRRRSSR